MDSFLSGELEMDIRLGVYASGNRKGKHMTMVPHFALLLINWMSVSTKRRNCYKFLDYFKHA